MNAEAEAHVDRMAWSWLIFGADLAGNCDMKRGHLLRAELGLAPVEVPSTIDTLRDAKNAEIPLTRVVEAAGRIAASRWKQDMREQKNGGQV